MHLWQLFSAAKSPCGCCRCLVSSFIRRDAKSTCKQLPGFHLQHNSYCVYALRENYCVSCLSFFFFSQKKLTSALNITSSWTMLMEGPGNIHVQRSVYTCLNTCSSLCSHHSCANPSSFLFSHAWQTPCHAQGTKTKTKKGKFEQCFCYLELVWCVAHCTAGWWGLVWCFYKAKSVLEMFLLSLQCCQLSETMRVVPVTEQHLSNLDLIKHMFP